MHSIGLLCFICLPDVTSKHIKFAIILTIYFIPQLCMQKLSHEALSTLDIETGALIINVNKPNQKSMLVDAICNICLLNYKVGNVITYSSNEECHHVFHRDCVLHWLHVKNNCPCCHHAFLEV